MRNAKRWVLMAALATCSTMLSAAPRQPTLPVSPLDTVETIRGTVEVKAEGRAAVVTVEKPDGSGLRRFDVDLQEPSSFLEIGSAPGEIRSWRGHLVVVSPTSGEALHFALADIVRPARIPVAPLSTASEVADLDRVLGSRYQLTKVAALGITSLSGPRALEAGSEIRSLLAPVNYDYQDPGPGGIGSCGASCNITCGDGSTCQATCSGTRCASCSCPASCSCK